MLVSKLKQCLKTLVILGRWEVICHQEIELLKRGQWGGTFLTGSDRVAYEDRRAFAVRMPHTCQERMKWHQIPIFCLSVCTTKPATNTKSLQGLTFWDSSEMHEVSFVATFLQHERYHGKLTKHYSSSSLNIESFEASTWAHVYICLPKYV